MGNGNRRRGQVMLLLLCLCLAGILTAGFRNEAKANPLQRAAANGAAAGAAGQSNDARGTDGLKQSLPLLTELGQSATMPGSPIRLVLKWQGEYVEEGAERLEGSAAAAKLSARLGLGKLTSAEEDEHKTYRSAGNSAANTRISLFWSELGAGRSYVIVTVETADLLHAAGFQDEAVQAGDLMQQTGITADWNASLQGLAKEQGAPEQALLLTEKSMSKQVSGIHAAESYADETTYSRSYTVPGLERFVRSGEHLIGLQAAVHKNGNNATNRVTIGFPLITIEY